jgi:ketosteroid isomerase-like protein
MRQLAAGVLILLLAIPAWPQQASVEPAFPSTTLPPELDRVLRDYERAWQAHDAAGLANLFAEDGFVLANGGPPVRGRNAIREAYSHAGGPLALRALAYATQEGVGYIIGSYGHPPATGDTGKFVLALKRGRDGRWLIMADIDNASQRKALPPQAKPSPAGVP